MKGSKVLLNLSAFVCYIYGAVYLFTLVFIPLGVYCFIAARRFSFKADHINDIYSLDKKVFRNYVIFASIACFPLGMLSIIPYLLLCGNNVRVSETQSEASTENNNTESTIRIDDASIEEKAENQTETKTAESASSESENQKSSENKKHEEVVATEPETMAEKQEKFKKLQSFNEKGLVTDEELEMARVQLFGKDDKNN